MQRKALYCTEPYPIDGAMAPAGSKVNVILLADGVDYAPPAMLELRDDDGSPVWAPAPIVVVPEMVANADLRAVLLTRFLPTGQSYFNAVENYLASDKTNTAALADNDPRKISAWTAYAQWDMGNFFRRKAPLVSQLGALFGLTDADLDAIFVQAGPPITPR